jgi:hypothetical protein
MSDTLIALDANQHRAHGWKRHDHLRFAAADAVAPLLMAELTAALPYYPIAFVQRPDENYQMVAVQGLNEGQNLYIGPTGRGFGGYIPSCYRGYPFALRKTLIDGEQRLVLAFDTASGLYRDAPDPAQGEERFFEDDGTPRAMVARALEFLKQSAANQAITKAAVEALAAANLLTPWALPVENPDPRQPPQQHLYRIDETALIALPANDLAALRNASALAIAYAQIFSMPRLGLLSRLHQHHRAHPASTDASLAGLLDESETDGLRFDWD